MMTDTAPHSDPAATVRPQPPALVAYLATLPAAVISRAPGLPSHELRKRILDAHDLARITLDAIGWRLDPHGETVTTADGAVWLLLGEESEPELIRAGEGEA